MVSVDETKIRAVLKNGSTAVTVPVLNSADHPVKAQLTLGWLTTNDKESSRTEREIVIERGLSTVEVAAPLIDPSIWTRLRYGLTPGKSEAKTFGPIGGVLSLSHIANYAFELKASIAGAVRRGGSITLHAEAVHPVSRLPISGADWEAILTVDKMKLSPRQTAKRQEGFVDFVFDVPASPDSNPDEEATVEVTAKRGDFEQSASIPLRVPARLSGNFQSDKPIYQPGQTLHLRAVVQDAAGRAAAGAKVALRVEDPDNERVHTAQLVASGFGVVQDDWALPASAILGTYQIVLTGAGGDDYQIARHAVRVSRYELPTFNVTVKPDRSAYLPSESAHVTISATYLFGKAVPKGRVKLVRSRRPRWNSKTRKSESADEIVVQGEATQDGTFVAEVSLKAEHEDLHLRDTERFENIHFAAYYTDPSSHRTEQRRFDLRITREPIHVYLIRTDGGGSLPAPVYVSTSYADGRPASAAVEIHLQGQTATLRTNRYGIGKVDVVRGIDVQDGVLVRASDAGGQTGTWKEGDWPAGGGLLRIQTARTIHRAGEAVTLQITSPPEAPADQAVMIHAVAGDHRVATRVAQVTNHHGEVTFPYQPEFRRAIVFVAWNAVDPHRDYQDKVLGSRAVIFPDGSDLTLSASVGRDTYKPGEQASVSMQVRSRDGKPVEAAVALAVVDQAVLERARTDSGFGHRPWFACAFCRDEGESEIGGIRLNDLYALKAASPITPELDLAAEALVARANAVIWSESSESLAEMPSFGAVTSQIQRLNATLSRHYGASLEFPEDLSALSSILGREWSDLVDPWGKPYSAQFSVDRENRVVSLLSAGPDKTFGSADDFIAGRFRRPYFTPIQHLIRQKLRKLDDYPSTVEEFSNVLREDGLLVTSLRDPWGTPYRIDVATKGAIRRINMTSAGPDKTFETRDDFIVDTFSGAYFRRQTAEIAGALRGVSPEPQSIDDFRAAMSRAGIDIAGFRDAWGQPYHLASIVSSRYADRINTTTTRVFGGQAAPRTEITAVTQKFIIFSLRSAGPDGLENTNDDFDIAKFPILQKGESAIPLPTGSNNRPVAGARATGAISGTVTDPSGAVVPNVTVTLFDVARTAFESDTGQDGVFHFWSVPIGTYSLRAASPGFVPYEISLVPVTKGNTTTVDLELRVGSVAESVTVEAAAETLQTETASVSASGPTATPRVREYFPETLLWLPELLTGPAGSASSRFALADSVTTWKVAAFASTVDGRSAQTETEFRSFQPFFVDFNPPQLLTDGDQIELPVAVRNYQDSAQSLSLALRANDWSTTLDGASKRVSVPANSSRNVSFLIQAKRPLEKGALRIVAGAGRKGDAIEKSVRVRPDGQEVVRTFGDFVVGNATISVPLASGAIPNASRAELRIYPNFASLLLESSAAILIAPHGCAEQTISAGFANLVALRFARAAGIVDPLIGNRALANIRLAADGLSRFRSHTGGVRYWATGEPDIAVTAHALSFLVEASAVTPVNKDDLSQLVSWLEKAQAKDGKWLVHGGDGDRTKRQSLLLTAAVARALASALKGGIKVSGPVLGAAYHNLVEFADQTNEPYILANFVLAALDSGDESLLGKSVTRLMAMGREERGGIYWDLQTNSPFYGWGTAGRFETTGLVVSALSAWKANHGASLELDSSIRRGLVFLLRGRDSTGGWFSTQSTLRAMRAVADASSALGSLGGQGGTIEIRSNGRKVKTITMPSDAKATDPVLLDLSAFLSAGDNQISLVSNGSAGGAPVRLTASHWIPWEQTTPRSSAEFRFNVTYDRLDAPVGEPVRCSVKAERVGFRGYGMMLAEIGLPPGADVDRSSLESVIESGAIGLDHYDILPDRVVLYLWPKAGGVAFDFFLTTRNTMLSKSAASVLYDYYNPEAISELAPSRWTVK